MDTQQKKSAQHTVSVHCALQKKVDLLGLEPRLF